MALNGYKIYVDAGHGGSDPGATNGNYTEKEFALQIATFLKQDLEAYGATVKMSRTGDTYPSLQTRAAEAKSWGAHIYCSVHINSGGGTGVETWVHDNANANTNSLASYVNNAMASDLGVANRGVKKAPSQRPNRDNIYVIDPKNTSAWAILPEVLFIDTQSDLNKLLSSKQIAAGAIARGINSFSNTMPGPIS